VYIRSLFPRFASLPGLGNGVQVRRLGLRGALLRRAAAAAAALLLELLAAALLLGEQELDGLALHGHLVALHLQHVDLGGGGQVGRRRRRAARARDRVRVVLEAVAGEEVVVGQVRRRALLARGFVQRRPLRPRRERAARAVAVPRARRRWRRQVAAGRDLHRLRRRAHRAVGAVRAIHLVFFFWCSTQKSSLWYS